MWQITKCGNKKKKCLQETTNKLLELEYIWVFTTHVFFHVKKNVWVNFILTDSITGNLKYFGNEMVTHTQSQGIFLKASEGTFALAEFGISLTLLPFMVEFNLDVSVCFFSQCLPVARQPQQFSQCKNDLCVYAVSLLDIRLIHQVITVFPWQYTELSSTELYIHNNPAKKWTLLVTFCSVGIYLYNTTIINKYIHYFSTVYKSWHFFGQWEYICGDKHFDGCVRYIQNWLIAISILNIVLIESSFIIFGNFLSMGGLFIILL
jgi:hypothetical protein